MKRRKPIPKGLIPLCKSLFLQEVCIALGRRMKAVRFANRRLTITSAFMEGEDEERLAIEARTWLNLATQIVIWADGAAWIWQAAKPKQGTDTIFELHADLSQMDCEAIAELLRRSLINLEEVTDAWQLRALP